MLYKIYISKYKIQIKVLCSYYVECHHTEIKEIYFLCEILNTQVDKITYCSLEMKRLSVCGWNMHGACYVYKILLKCAFVGGFIIISNSVFNSNKTYRISITTNSVCMLIEILQNIQIPCEQNAEFTKNQYQFLAKYSFLFLVRSTTCFGQIYWASSGSHMHRRFNLELSHVVTNVVVFTGIKLLKSACIYNLNLKAKKKGFVKQMS